jgi:16S rRNA processing protein RimM
MHISGESVFLRNFDCVESHVKFATFEVDSKTHIEIGVIQRKHGLKGEVRVLFHQQVPLLAKMHALFVQMGHTLVPYGITHLTLQQGKAIVKLQGVDHANSAHALQGKAVFALSGTLTHSMHAHPKPHNLVGYQVVDVQEGYLGTVQAIYTPSLQQLLAVDYQGKELLIPNHEAIIKDVVHAQRNVTVQLPAGFIEASL